MSDRRDYLRTEAARFLQAARSANEPNLRAKLIWLAGKFIELSERTPSIDFDSILGECNAQRMSGSAENGAQTAQQRPPGTI